MKHPWKIKTLAFAVVGALVSTIGFSGDVLARKVCDDGSYPPCNTEGETATNNLSLPLFMTKNGTTTGGFTGVTCPNVGFAPSGIPQSGYPLDPLEYYFVQGIHKWQAPCDTWDADANGPVPVTAAWGDNLSGDAKLKAGSPIRVELLLTYAPPPDEAAEQDGYTVEKLDPAALDRESSYGTLATSDDGGQTYFATPVPFMPLVFDYRATLTITGDGFLATEEPASAEINATGKVVYGYNLRVPTPGQYQITYTLPNVDIQSADAGYCVDQTCSLTITVGGGGGGGGGKPR